MGLMKNEWAKGKEFSAWKNKLYQNWSRVRFITVSSENKNGDMSFGMKYPIVAEVELGELTPADVEVQIYYGKADEISYGNKSYVTMNNQPKKNKSTVYAYKGEIECKDTGQFGYTLRVVPKNDLLENPFELGLIRWA
jgi:starch phosphorylase